MAEKVFAELKVIDCASWIAGPAAATILSDFGANVIKIEPPGAGDPWRAFTPVPGKTTDYCWQWSLETSAAWLSTSSTSTALPFSTAHCHRRCLRHQFSVACARASEDRSLDLLAVNPRLIYASLTAYGEQGEEAARAGFDSTVYWARTGLMDMVRATENTEPARSVPGMGDHPSATALYAAIATALYRREKTGKGGVAQSSLLQNGAWANACFIQSRLFGEHVPHRAPRAEAPNPLANHYRCRDGRWFLMALFNEQRQLRGFLTAIGCTHLADDPRFAT